jgi:ferredoxin--NADP+ reductase
VIPNVDGRVTGQRGGAVVPGQYVVGWAKRGPTGLIGTNSPDSKETVKALCADFQGRTAKALPAGDEAAIEKLLRERRVDFVTYRDWLDLDAHEVAVGERVGKVRQKLSDVGEMMRVVGELRRAR